MRLRVRQISSTESGVDGTFRSRLSPGPILYGTNGLCAAYLGRSGEAPPLLVIRFTVFVDLIGFGVIISRMPFYTKAVGGGAAILGLLVAAFFAMQSGSIRAVFDARPFAPMFNR